MSGPAPAVDLLAEEPLEEEIIDDAAAETSGDGGAGEDRAHPVDAWRGPSLARWVLFAVIAIGVLVVDQLAKAWVVAMLPEPGTQRVVIDGWLNVVHGRNSGALFGLLPQ